MVARADLRRHWRGTIAVALLVALVGGVTLAALAGARRSASSLRRFQEASRASDFQFVVSGYTPAQLARLRRAPGVDGVGIVELLFVGPKSPAFDHIQIAATIDRKLGTEVDRPRLVAGRLANPDAADEINIGEGLAQRAHLGIGDAIETQSMSTKGFAALQRGGPFRFDGPQPELHIVGIVRRPLDLASLGSAGGVVLMTPAFDRVYRKKIANPSGYTFRVRASDPELANRSIQQIFGKDPAFLPQSLTSESAGARDAINVLTDVLLIFAAVIAIAGTVAIAIVLSRELASTRMDQETLDALGISRLQRAAMSGARVLVLAFAGTSLAVLGAIAASPHLPFGVARRADPDPGLHADWFVLALGAIGLIAIVVAIASVEALHSTRIERRADGDQRVTFGARVSTTAAAAGLSPAATAGLRLAAEPGRAERAVPVRSAVFGVAFGSLGVCALLVFASSLGQLSSTPRRYGWGFDVRAESTGDQACRHRNDAGASHIPGVESVGIVCYASMQFAGHPTIGWELLPVKGRPGPEIVEGRAPATPREVALGATTMHTLGKQIGDLVHTRGAHGRTVTERIVGQAVFPQFGDAQPLAEGVWFTVGGWVDAGATQDQSSRELVVGYAPGADHGAVVRRISALPGFSQARVPAPPAEIDRLTKIDWFPTGTAALLAVLALIAVAHAIATSTRRRQRDLAILQTMGFERPQIRRTVEWQATALAVGGLVVGVPVGILAGAAVWRAIAGSLGVRAIASLPVELLLVAPVALVAVNLIASVPGRTVSRHHPAVSLRAE
jgi:hypothetical protein